MFPVARKSSAGSVSFRWRRLFTVNAYGVFTQIHDVNQKNNSFHWKIKNFRERLQKMNKFMKSYMLLLIVLCSCLQYLYFAVIVWAEELTPEDITAGYRQNADYFVKSRICYWHTEQNYDYSTNSGGEIKNEPDAFLYDYWSDNQNILLRKQIGAKENVHKQVEMMVALPDNISEKDMSQHYRSMEISSYFIGDRLGRYWFGYKVPAILLQANTNDAPPSVAHATISRDIPTNKNPGFLFPPFLPYSFDIDACVFPTDYFFSIPCDDTSILGETKIDNKVYLVVEKRKNLTDDCYN
jgi:hypothetical protein